MVTVFRHARAGAYHGFPGRLASALLGSGMIGQKMLYSFSLSLAGKGRAHSPEPAHQRTGLAAAAQQNADAAASPAKTSQVGQEDPSTLPSSRLSPSKLVRIRRNKDARLRLAARNVPVGFGESWQTRLGAAFGKPYFIKLMGFVAEERKHYTVYPPPHRVFTWIQMCALRHVKVVILGQDPFHGPNQAHGLCFSVRRPVPPPPSLENIYKELSTDLDGFVHPGHLSGWAKQGVLLLNAVLMANSHKERGWEQFTDAVVSWLDRNSSGLVFLLWGSYAQKKGSAIDRKGRHVLQAAQPSPLSGYRGFFQCRHFSKTNELQQKSGKEPINWKD
ncbi:hypothetical protein GH733_009317, partial [Mirounga leonina]